MSDDYDGVDSEDYHNNSYSMDVEPNNEDPAEGDNTYDGAPQGISNSPVHQEEASNNQQPGNLEGPPSSNKPEEELEFDPQDQDNNMGSTQANQSSNQSSNSRMNLDDP